MGVLDIGYSVLVSQPDRLNIQYQISNIAKKRETILDDHEHYAVRPTHPTLAEPVRMGTDGGGHRSVWGRQAFVRRRNAAGRMRA